MEKETEQPGSGTSAGSPAGGNYGKREEQQENGLPTDDSDKKTKEMGNNPEEIERLRNQEAANTQSLKEGEATDQENTGSGTENKNRGSGR
jgi:hypothetical protein